MNNNNNNNDTTIIVNFFCFSQLQQHKKRLLHDDDNFIVTVIVRSCESPVNIVRQQCMLTQELRKNVCIFDVVCCVCGFVQRCRYLPTVACFDEAFDDAKDGKFDDDVFASDRGNWDVKVRGGALIALPSN